jgi:hypothetical protein
MQCVVFFEFFKELTEFLNIRDFSLFHNFQVGVWAYLVSSPVGLKNPFLGRGKVSQSVKLFPPIQC